MFDKQIEPLTAKSTIDVSSTYSENAGVPHACLSDVFLNRQARGPIRLGREKFCVREPLQTSRKFIGKRLEFFDKMKKNFFITNICKRYLYRIFFQIFMCNMYV